MKDKAEVYEGTYTGGFFMKCLGAGTVLCVLSTLSKYTY